eukprot:TRINITY_DN9401_c0_g1_i2.p1 TRINITY_DN9401_c0_g1~~TRINITY_DN9401_c0_g1_i2.p1  ORF type:complete len:338 (+),score=33.23 TRINITY_DN9401_c0_g1_i2:37-1014(+)
MACLPAAACFAGVGSCKSPRRSAEHAPKLVSNEKERIEGRLRSKSEDFIFGETCDRSSSPSDDGRHIVESPICPEKSKSLTFSPKSPALRDRIPYADLHLSLSFNIRTSDEAETVIEDYQESEGSQYSQYHSMTPQSSYWLGTMTPQSSQLGGSVTPASSYWGDESWYDQNTDNVDYAEPEESVISEHHCSAGVVGARKVRGQGVFFIVEVVGDTSRVVLKRYRQFEELDHMLRRKLPPGSLPNLPPKSLIIRRSFSKSFMQKREQALGDYIKAAVAADPLLVEPALRQFVGILPSDGEDAHEQPEPMAGASGAGRWRLCLRSRN